MKFHLAAFADEVGTALSAQMDALRRNGIGMLEMRGVNGKNCADLTLEETKDICQRLQDAGMRVWSLGSPFGKIDIREDFAPHFDQFRRSLENCARTDIRRIRVFSFYMPEGERAEDYRTAVIDRLGRMLEAAKGAGVTLCHENEKGIYGDNAARCLDLYRSLGSEGLRGVFDPANFIQVGQDTPEALDMLSPYIDYLHIKDACKADGRIVPAGQGDGHLPEILAHFAARRDGMTLTVEPHLRMFSGLSALERKGGRSEADGRFAYESEDAAFDAACSALKALL